MKPKIETSDVEELEERKMETEDTDLLAETEFPSLARLSSGCLSSEGGLSHVKLTLPVIARSASPQWTHGCGLT